MADTRGVWKASETLLSGWRALKQGFGGTDSVVNFSVMESTAKELLI